LPTYTRKVNEITIRLNVEALEEGVYCATSPDVPGLVVQGRTISECMELARDIARVFAESYIENGDPLPPVFQNVSRTEIIELTVPIQVA
jgi:predicted RNase H-like HicB family nuclease